MLMRPPEAGPVNGARLVTGPMLILGAGGFLGLNTVRACLAAGHQPLCGRRSRGNVLGLRALNVATRITDFDDVDSLAAAMAGIAVVIHAAAHYPRFSDEPEVTLARGLRELENVLEAAARAGVCRLVFVSSTATIAPRADGRPSAEGDRSEVCQTFGVYHRLKWALEQRVAVEDRFEVTVVNPAACLGPFDWKVGTAALVVATAQGLRPQYPAGLVSTVDVRDVADALCWLASAAEVPDRLILANEAFASAELMSLLATRYRAPPPVAPLTADAARGYADACERTARLTNSRAMLSREFVDLIVHAPHLDSSLSKRLGVTYRPLTDTLSAWDAWAHRMGLLTPREHAKVAP